MTALTDDLASVDDLVRRMLPRIEWAVEPLQVAAALESDGVTDRIARDSYGFNDVFELAQAAFARLPAVVAGPVVPDAAPRQARPFAQMAHGLLYAMPAALLPAASALVGVRYLMPGLVLTTAVGWIWGSTGARAAYGLLGRGRPAAAGRALRITMLGGVAAAMVMIGSLAVWYGGGAGLIVLCMGQMAFQMASAVLLFYRAEIRLAVLMAPGVIAGVAYLALSGPRAALAAVGLGICSITGIFVAALVMTRRAGDDATAGRPLAGADLAAMLLPLVYSMASAVFLLQAEARYVLDRADIAIAGVPLVLGMGILEYRTHRFEDDARALMGRVRYPRQFVLRSRRLLRRGLLKCLGALGALAALLLAVLSRADPVAPEVALMAVAHVVVGGAYFLSFVLANQGKIRQLCVAQGLALAAHPGVWLVLPAARTSLADIAVFLGASVLFLLILLGFALASLRHVQQYG
ncbi:hypothetical protein [Nonomuraea soli]|uniref:Uncharacterized protein n=1 Tax=Nonomuraea soli TaxID=1032476 RepID=A0A7W0HNX9_9ACTN|nr:hypothetical protein [Nonomuraea soli]MBA2890274.1 hypothetical protein [Nonomuraea soli]